MITVSAELGQTVSFTVQPVNASGAVVAGAKFTGLSGGSSDTSIATVGAQASDGSFPVTLLKAGSVTISAAAVVTDENGVVSQNVTGQVTLTITGTAETTGLQLTFTVQ